MTGLNRVYVIFFDLVEEKIYKGLFNIVPPSGLIEDPHLYIETPDFMKCITPNGYVGFYETALNKPFWHMNTVHDNVIAYCDSKESVEKALKEILGELQNSAKIIDDRISLVMDELFPRKEKK